MQCSCVVPALRHRYIPDDSITDPSKIERLILCCGQIYYDLHAERDRIRSEYGTSDNPGQADYCRWGFCSCCCGVLCCVARAAIAFICVAVVASLPISLIFTACMLICYWFLLSLYSAWISSCLSRPLTVVFSCAIVQGSIHTCSFLLLRFLCICLGNKVALARVEQLSPFPFDLAIRDLQIYPNLRTVVWAQEEPMNQGEANA